MGEEMGEIESLESWLEKKPYWEQHIWGLCFDKELLTNEDIELCFKYLKKYLELFPSDDPNPGKITFSDKVFPNFLEGESSTKVTLLGIKEPINVNALPPDFSLKFNPN